ncbi:Sulfotransferase domain [Trinorchestia longiramus]|nr:Sulfotransferase domain [Trinorchestia longiramus]
MKLSNGAVISPVTGEEAKDLLEKFHGYKTGLVRVSPSDCLLPAAYTNFAEKYLSFQFRSSDVVVLTYPKCGTTWMQEIVWTMCHNPNLDNPEGEVNLAVRAPFLEFDTIVANLTSVGGHNSELVEVLKAKDPSASPDDGLFLGLARVASDRRVIKSHLPFTLLPANMLDTCKVVFVARNPKDAITSFLHHHRLIKIHDYKGTDDQFVDYFCSGQVAYGPYEEFVAEGWARKDHKNLLFILFEDLKKDPMSQLKKIDKFLGTTLNEKQLENVMNRTGFANMKERLGVQITAETQQVEKVEAQGVNDLFDKNTLKKGDFFRTGKSGGWKDEISAESSAKIDEWIAEKLMPRTPGLKFEYE